MIADPAFGRPAKGDTVGMRFGPLRPADDAIIIDTTNRSPAAIVDEIMALMDEHLLSVEDQ